MQKPCIHDVDVDNILAQFDPSSFRLFIVCIRTQLTDTAANTNTTVISIAQKSANTCFTAVGRLK